MKPINAILFLAIFGVALTLRINAQTDKSLIGLSVQANSYPQLDMVSNYSYGAGNSSLSTKSLFGGEINLYYGRNILPDLEIRIGLLGGIQPYGIELYAVNFDPNAPNRFFTDDLSGYEVSYIGLKIETEWRFWGTKDDRHSLVIYPGLITAYHIPRSISLEYTNLFNNGTRITLFEAEDIEVNENNRLAIGATLGLGYRNRISEKIYLSLGCNIMYSGKTIMKTTSPYTLNSIDGVRTGNFSHRFMSAGLNIGVSYLLGSTE